MSEVESWHQGNDEYLTAALAWLRLRLQYLAQHNSPARVAPPPPPERRHLFGRQNSAKVVALPAPSKITEEELRRASSAMKGAEERLSPPPALKLLSEQLGLSIFEQQVLLLCAAMELDTRIADLCAQVSNHPYPTFALALMLFNNASWSALSPEGPLRYWRLLEINQPGAQTLTTSALRADERIVNALKGLNYLDDRLRPLMTTISVMPAGVPLPPSQKVIVDAAVNYLRSNDLPFWPIIQLVGSDPSSSRMAAQHVASILKLPLYRLSATNIPTQTGDLENLARLWQREGLLAPAALYLDAHNLDESSAYYSASLRFLESTDGIIFLATNDVWSGLGREVKILEVGKPTTSEQHDIWKTVLDNSAEVNPSSLAAQFDLNLETICKVARRELQSNNSQPLQKKLWNGCRKVAHPRLENLAVRIEAKATWEQLVLPEPELKLLHQITDQVSQRSKVYQDWGFAQTMNRGLGISALFAGESGTGKTMAAEVIANELCLDLHRIDLSSVVSKYIGETEKNLRKLFDGAENGGAILFFDEADALFGKRSEVKDAHDRYANIEINYLLQRMEAYRGLAILATNMKSSLDTAFVRRLRFIVDFSFPNASDRKRMWEKVFPASTPTNGLDYERLAKLNLTGATIHNAAVNAAFLAAKRESLVSMREVLEAARNEFKKLERPVNEADFRWES